MVAPRRPEQFVGLVSFEPGRALDLCRILVALWKKTDLAIIRGINCVSKNGRKLSETALLHLFVTSSLHLFRTVLYVTPAGGSRWGGEW